MAALVLVGMSHATSAAPAPASARCKAAIDAAIEAAIDADDWEPARDPCREAARSDEIRDLMRLGYVYGALDDFADAHAVADRVAKKRPGHGHRLRSQILQRQLEHGRAFDEAKRARDVHASADQWLEVMRDAVSVSQLAWRLGDFTTAQGAAEDAVRLARLARLGRRVGVEVDDGVAVRAQIALADALRRMGDHAEAEHALEEALAWATTPCDRAWSHLKRGMVHDDNRERSLAREQFDAAHGQLGQRKGAGQACALTIATSIALYRARYLAPDDPAAAEKIVDDITRAQGESFDTRFVRGLAAGHRGDLGAAVGHLARTAEHPAPDPDWEWEILQARAEVAELRGDALGDLMAESFYRRSIARVNALHASAPAQAAFVVASHRAPYDGLIALLARQGRWRDVVAVVLELDAGDMLRAAAASDRVPVATASSVPAPAIPAVDAVVAAWRGRDLVIVIAPVERLFRPGAERVVRVRVVDGVVTGATLGAAATARVDADVLFGDHDDARAAPALGALIVPVDERTETLDVLAIGMLSKVPLAALRDPSGEPILARRPLARVLSIRPRGARSAPAAREIVIADPRGNLPGAYQEGRLVAARVGPTAVLLGPDGAPATRAGLAAARDARLLHVAAHVAARGRWRALLLADGDVMPSELIGLAPRLAVLASCGSGAARDLEGWGSIAAALLSAGTEAVIATDRSVVDQASLELVRRFYAQPDWRNDPARALARVQVALRDDGVSIWADFGILHGPPSARP